MSLVSTVVVVTLSESCHPSLSRQPSRGTYPRYLTGLIQSAVQQLRTQGVARTVTQPTLPKGRYRVTDLPILSSCLRKRIRLFVCYRRLVRSSASSSLGPQRSNRQVGKNKEPAYHNSELQKHASAHTSGSTRQAPYTSRLSGSLTGRATSVSNLPEIALSILLFSFQHLSPRPPTLSSASNWIRGHGCLPRHQMASVTEHCRQTAHHLRL